MASTVLLSFSKDEVDRVRLFRESWDAAAEARREGERQGRMEVDRNLKNLGLAPELTHGATALSLDVIESL